MRAPTTPHRLRIMKKIKKKFPQKKQKKKTPELFWWEALLTGVSNREAVQDALFRLGTTGLVDGANGLTAYFEPSRFPKADALAELLRTNTQCRIEIKKIPAQDWESEWKKNFKPKKISKHFIVRPSWEKYKKKKNEIVLIIDPKMSFGTGTHETTQLMTRLMEKHLSKGAILDIGTGTGILAIAAAKLGCKKIYALDVDEHSYENALENIRRNRCGSRIEVLQTEVGKRPSSWPDKYETILANIQKNVILELLDSIRRLLSPRGVLLVSGILTDEDENMRRAFTDHRFKIIEFLQDGEWVAYALTQHEIL